MGEALGGVLPLAVAVAVFPLPVIAVALVLGSARGRTKALAFCCAWYLGLVVVGTIVLVVAGAVGPTEGSEPATWVSILLLVLGSILLWLAVKQWLSRPRSGAEAPLPGWMLKVNEFTIAKAASAGFALSALNPKNLLLVAAAAAEIAEVGLSRGQQALALVAFALIASLGVLSPLALAVLRGERADRLLVRLRTWMAANNAVIMTVLFVVIGAKLIGDAISGLSA